MLEHKYAFEKIKPKSAHTHGRVDKILNFLKMLNTYIQLHEYSIYSMAYTILCRRTLTLS